MFDKNLLNVETGFFFNIEQMEDRSCVQFRSPSGDEQAVLAESFETLDQAQQRFEELKKILIPINTLKEE